VDYAVTQLSPSQRSFTNPPFFGFEPVLYTVRVQNVGQTVDGPASLRLSLARVNATCPAPFVLPSQYSLTLNPGKSATRTFFVLFFSCGNPWPPVDYIATARVSAPGDTNPANDTKTGTVDVRKRGGWWW
jgi:hypothetical protein